MVNELFITAVGKEMTIGSRIRLFRNTLKMTQKSFAESLGIVQGFLSAIEKGKKNPSDTLLIALQHLYKINPLWIHTGEGEITQGRRHTSTAQSKNTVTIPLFKKLHAVHEEFKLPIPDSYISLPDLPLDGFAFEYSGDYMLPTVRDADIIVIKPDETISSGSIALIVGKWGEPFLRRYREINGNQYFSSDNRSYATFQPDSSTRILGVVVKVWREIKI